MSPLKSRSKKPTSRKPKGGAQRKAPARKKSIAPRKKPARKPRAPVAAAAVQAPAENPRARALAQKIARAVLDKKATEVVILDVRGMTSYADYFVVASGESDRQVTAMADAVTSRLKQEEQLAPFGSEGQETGNWVLLDYGEVVAHLFFAEVRAFYDLEGLWADAPREQVA